MTWIGLVFRDSWGWETILHGSQGCLMVPQLCGTSCKQRHWLSFVTDYLFKDVCMESSLDRWSVSHWSEGQAYLLSRSMNIISLFGGKKKHVYCPLQEIRVRVLLLHHNLLHKQASSAFFLLLFGSWGFGSQCKKMLILWIMNLPLSLTQEACVSYQHPLNCCRWSG